MSEPLGTADTEKGARTNQKTLFQGVSNKFGGSNSSQKSISSWLLHNQVKTQTCPQEAFTVCGFNVGLRGLWSPSHFSAGS